MLRRLFAAAAWVFRRDGRAVKVDKRRSQDDQRWEAVAPLRERFVKDVLQVRWVMMSPLSRIGDFWDGLGTEEEIRHRIDQAFGIRLEPGEDVNVLELLERARDAGA